MHLVCDYPIASLFFRHWLGPDDSEVGIVLAKARFLRTDGIRFRLDPAAPSLVLSDQFEGDPAVTPLVAEQDLAPAKPATDLILRATARSPRAEPLTDWPVRVLIPDRLSYEFQVRGPSEWRKTRGHWSLTRPELLTEVPLSYALAYGGLAPGRDATPQVFDGNPAGRGFATPALLDAGAPFAAPQIGELADFLSADPLQSMMVHGLGPIAKGWTPRRAWAGTFDARWQATRHPRMPLDHDPRYWNAAPRPLQLDPKLTGAETLVVHGISSAEAPVRIALPGAGLLLQAFGPGGDSAADRIETLLDLDTVELDLSAADPARHSLMLTWRTLVRNPDRYSQGQLYGIDVRTRV